MTIDFAKLSQPFDPREIEWRVGQKSKDGKKATLLAYLTSRAVQTRLDEVVGPARWTDTYTPVIEGAKTVGYLCTLAIEVQVGQWVGKTDVSDLTDIEALKGGVSGALKRAAVKWGIGRYLYDLDTRYHEIREGYGPDGSVYVPLGSGSPGHIVPPALPEWARPKAAAPPPKPEPRPEAKPEPKKAPEPDPDVLESVRDQLVALGWARPTLQADVRDFAAWLGVAHDPWKVSAERLVKLPDWIKANAAFEVRWERWWATVDELLEDHGIARSELDAWCDSLTKPRPSTMNEDARGKLLAYLMSGDGLERLVRYAEQRRAA